jgi:lipoate-protein ligase A
VTTAPRALFDPEPLRTLDRPTLVRPAHARWVVVLGSSQPLGDLDLVALERDGIGLRRRRGGGGAVLLHPEDLWYELWLPRSDADPVDVRAAACRMGERWLECIAAFGLAGEVHRGGVDHPAQGAIACFASIGPGEVTVAGSKLVGISQWRVRQGSLLSSVLAVRPPDELSGYLTRAVPRLGSAAHVPTALAPEELDETLTRVLRRTWPDLEVRSLP